MRIKPPTAVHFIMLRSTYLPKISYKILFSCSCNPWAVRHEEGTIFLSTIIIACPFIWIQYYNMPIIFFTNRTSVLEKEDWKNVVDVFTNAKQVVTSVQDVARKLVDYAKFRSQAELSGKTCLFTSLFFLNLGMFLNSWMIKKCV